MNIDDLFCPKCGRLKRKCICKKESIKQKNIDILFSIAGNRKDLRPIFECNDEIVFYRIFKPFNPHPTIPIENARILKPLENALKSRGIEKL